MSAELRCQVIMAQLLGSTSSSGSPPCQAAGSFPLFEGAPTTAVVEGIDMLARSGVAGEQTIGTSASAPTSPVIANIR
jgi:hypothetical protein